MGRIRETLGLGPSKSELALQEAEQLRGSAMAHVREGMTAMMQLSLALEERGFMSVDNLDRKNDGQLTFRAIKEAASHGAALVTANPIMHSAAIAQSGYIWGDGVRIKGAKRLVEKNAFNRRTVFGSVALFELEMLKIGSGNIFFALRNQRITRIPLSEIRGAIYDPEDPSFIRYFFREWTEISTDFSTGVETDITYKRLYPNREFDMNGGEHPGTITGVTVDPETVIHHVAANRIGNSPWGIPDILAGIFYSGEHKELIEAADAIYRAQSQYAVTYKAKTRKALEAVAASIAGPVPIDPRTGEPMEYGQTQGLGGDIDMQLTQKIGAGIDFKNFDPIAGLAAIALQIPVDVVLGREGTDSTLPKTTKQRMKMHRLFWTEHFKVMLEYMGATKVDVYFPPLDPDPTHRQIQSIVGAAKTKTISPEETRQLLIDTFGMDASATDLPDPKDWEPFEGQKVNPGSTEPVDAKNGPITPGQGQSGQLGKLADGDHSLRDEGQQAHTQK